MLTCYIVSRETDPCELPVACFDTLVDVANFLCVTRRAVYLALSMGRSVKGYKVEKIALVD